MHLLYILLSVVHTSFCSALNTTPPLQNLLIVGVSRILQIMNFLNFYTSNGKFPSSTLPRLICVWIPKTALFLFPSQAESIYQSHAVMSSLLTTPLLLLKASLNLPQFLAFSYHPWKLTSVWTSPKGSGLSFSYFSFFNLQWPFALFDFVDLICHLCCWLLWLIQSAPPPVLLIHSTRCPAYLFSCLSTMILWPHQDVQSIYFPTSLLTSPCFISIPSRSHFIGLHFFEFIFYICIFIFN